MVSLAVPLVTAPVPLRMITMVAGRVVNLGVVGVIADGNGLAILKEARPGAPQEINIELAGG